MSQMLVKPKNPILYSELHFEQPKIQLKSTASEVTCLICKSELKEGTGLTAKRLGTRLVLVCSSHGI